MQGVVARGTANAMRDLSPYVAGKTGTSEDENDAWFVGFTNDVTIAVWIGYDNGNGGGRRTLGNGETGGHVAVPIFRRIVEASWADYAPRAALAPPSPEARRDLVMQPVDLASGSRVAQGGPGTITEALRRDADGRIEDTQYRIVSQLEVGTYAPNDDGMSGDREGYYAGQQGYPYGQPSGQPGYYGGNSQPYPQQPPPSNNRGLFSGWFSRPPDPAPARPQPQDRAPDRHVVHVPDQQTDSQQSPERRFDPDYFWNNRLN
jgi:membrane peptidoglycan carboxypeptidase